MKLSRADATHLNNLLTTAALGGVESIVLDGGFASGLNSKNAMFITQTDVPALPQKMGISRLSVLRQRLELLVTDPDVTIDAKESDRGEIVQLEIAAGKSKIQFRCTNTALIKAPKQLNDDTLCKLTIDKDQLQLILNSIKVMGAKQISISLKDTGVATFITADTNNDRMSVELDKPIEWIIDEDDVESQVHVFNTDILSTMLRHGSTDDGITFSIGCSGTITIQLNGHNMYIFSQVDE